MFRKGTICIMRKIQGRWAVCPLVHQRDYKEWPGCFSYIGERDG